MTRSRDIADQQENLGGAVAPFVAGKNKIINGDFGVWQRGTSFTANSVYGPDRWFLTGTTSSMAITQVTSSLPSSFQYAIKLQRNSGVTATDILSIAQPFETSNSIPLQGQTITLSFWAKAGANFSGSGGLGLIRLYSGTGTNQSAASQFGGWTGYSEWQNSPTFAPTSTWTKFTSTGTVPANATQIGVRVGWSTVGTAGADDSLQITGMQIEAGSVATPFTTASGSIQGELALCQRYYFRTGGSATYERVTTMGTGASSTTITATLAPPVSMRIAPSAVEFSTLTFWDGTGGLNPVTSLTIASAGRNMTEFTVTASAGGITTHRPYFIVANNSTNAYLALSAEL
jgi:hypothetical protein